MILYYVLTTIGIAIGVYLSVVLRQQYLSLVIVFCAAVLWFYAISLKKVIFAGNIAVASMVALSVFIVYIFEPKAYNKEVLLWIFAAYAIFAFLINWVREIIKDIEDVEGDRSQGAKNTCGGCRTFLLKGTGNFDHSGDDHCYSLCSVHAI